MKAFAPIVLTFLLLNVTFLCCGQDHPQFRIGLIRIRFRTGMDDQAIDAFLRTYGVERKPEFKYDPKEAFRNPSSELVLYRSSALSEPTKWRLIIVPFGTENFWVGVFSKSLCVAQAKREEDTGSRSPTDDDFSWLGIPPKEIDKAQIEEDTFSVPATTTAEIFAKITSFFSERFKSQDAFARPTQFPNYRRFEIPNVRREVTSKYWELLVIDVVAIPDAHDAKMLELGLAVYGAYATGIPGSLKPDLDNFRGNLLQVDYKPQLTLFSDRLRAELAKYLTASSS